MTGLDIAFSARRRDARTETFVPLCVERGKRAFDILAALAGLVLTAALWPVIALAIRLDSRGPALFRQHRVGRGFADRTVLFTMLKFRSMCLDAEAGTGAVWATQRDARVTRVGWFLRRTRLDELPQLFNVLRGDMAIVGPRPERPELHQRLEEAVPFFADRTLGLRPGITGMAQVSQGYDTSLDDVRRKLGLDAAYAMRLTSARGWIATDMDIIARTFGVMVGGREQ